MVALGSSDVFINGTIYKSYNSRELIIEEKIFAVVQLIDPEYNTFCGVGN